MISKIFYSLVLYPNISYKDNIGLNYLLESVEERGIGTMEVIFSGDSKKESIFFTHIDFISCSEKAYLTKNWKLSGTDDDLLAAVYDIILKSDKYDFNFFKAKDFYEKIPYGTVLNITSKCNLFCDYCFNDYDYPLDTRNTRKTLGIEDFRRIIDELHLAGTRDVILTGGEPFCCSFIWELLDHLKEKNIFIRINTNGTLLTDEILSRLNEDYSVHLMVSMHEFNDKDYFETNSRGAAHIYGIDELKKWEGKFMKKAEQLKKIKDHKNLTMDFLTILTPKNILYLEDIFRFVLSNFLIRDWHFFRLFPTCTTKGITKEMIILAIHKLYKLNLKYNTGFKIVDSVPFCVTKDTEIASKVIEGELNRNHNVKTIITAEGNIQIMSAFDMHLGNILSDRIKDIWMSDFVQKKLTNGFLPESCYDCKYKEDCMGGSRMIANMNNGSYGALDPLCNINNKVRSNG